MTKRRKKKTKERKKSKKEMIKNPFHRDRGHLARKPLKSYLFEHGAQEPHPRCPRWWGKKVMGEEDWAQPPVPTELITVGKARTGSVQQEPELGPLQSRRCANRYAPEEPACYRPISQPEPRSHSGLPFEL
ncbi:hypothetical protein MHYP_G00005710 [Metynnis hypsauchen]